MVAMKLMLAPMENLTTPVFRELARNHACDLAFTEMARLSALARNNKSTLEKITIHHASTQIQIIGNKESKLRKFLEHYQPPIDKNAFRGINLNLGCPSPNFTNKGLGAAMMKRTAKINSMIKTVRDYSMPVSIKMRLGLNHYEKTKKVYLSLVENTDADFYIIHARHGKETYQDKPDYGIFPAVARTGKTIIANGNIDSAKKVQVLKDMGVKGVMIGRAAIRDPAIFERLKGKTPTTLEKLQNEFEQLKKTYGSKEKLILGRRPKEQKTRG